MLAEGKKAPGFTLPATGGKKVALSDFKGKVVVLYFYPRDNTPGCTTEAQEFQAALSVLKRKGVVVLGVNKDSIESHEKFAAKYKLKFSLLTDDGTVMMKYGAWGEKNLYGKKVVGIIRTTVVISPTGKVVEIFPKVRVRGHVKKVVEVIEGINANSAGAKKSTLKSSKVTNSRSTPAKKVVSKKSAPAKKAASKKSAPAKKAASKKSVPAKKAASKKSVPAKKRASIKKAASKKSVLAKKRAPVKKAASKKSAPAKKRAPIKKAASKKSAPAKKRAPVKKAASRARRIS